MWGTRAGCKTTKVRSSGRSPAEGVNGSVFRPAPALSPLPAWCQRQRCFRDPRGPPPGRREVSRQNSPTVAGGTLTAHGSPVPPRRPRAWLGRAPHAQGAACPFRGPRRKETRQSKLKQLKPHHLCCSEAHGQIHKYSKLLFRPGLMRFTAGLACGSSCEEPSDKLDCKSAG